MSDIFREVEEDVRRERLKGLWDRYGLLVVGLAVLIVLGTAGWRGWEWYTERQAAGAGETYYEALMLAERGDASAARAAFEDIAEGGGPFAPLARLRVAAELAETGERAAATEAYDALAADSGLDRRVRNLARIRAGYLLVGEVSYAELEERLGDLAAPQSAWRHSAREILGLAAYDEGDSARAAEYFQDIVADGEAPEDLRNRSQLMIALTAADQAPAQGDETASQ